MNQSFIKTIVLDLDNSILLDPKTGKGSEELKDESWKHILLKLFPETDWSFLKKTLEEAIRESSLSGFVYRDKIADFLSKKLTNNQDKSLKEKIMKDFSDELLKRILKINIPKETFLIIEKISKKWPVYINTATGTDYALSVLDNLKIRKFFKGIFGLPESKKENLLKILNLENIKPENILFIDDSPKNGEVAQELGCQFVAIKTNKYNWKDSKIPVIKSLNEISKIIKI